MRGFPFDGSRWLQTPCALRLGGPNPTSQPLTPSVAPWVLTRDVPSHVRRCPPDFRRETNTPRRQDPVRRHPVRGNAAHEPRVPSVGSISALRPSEAFRDPCYVRAKVLAPVRPKRLQHVPSRACGRFALLRPTSVCLAALLDDAEKMLLSDLCNRLTTRAPVDRSTSERATCAALTAGCFPYP
jgi:hypothetical protein